MLPKVVVLLAAASMVSAGGLQKLHARQDQSFRPDTNTITGSCASNGLTNCGDALCINPSQGDVCCSASASWGCPGGNFCLVDDFCCPDGLDPATCAANNGVTLPDDFSTDAPAEPTSAPSPSAPAYPPPTYPSSSAEPEEPSYTPPTYPTTTSTGYAPAPTNGTKPPTVTNKPPVYTGAANPQAVVGGWAVVAVAAAVGAFV